MAIVHAVVEHKGEFEEVILDWRRVLAFDSSPRDQRLIRGFAEIVERRGFTPVLVGSERIATYIRERGWPQGCPMITGDYGSRVPVQYLAALEKAVSKRAEEGRHTFVICDVDRLNRREIAEKLGDQDIVDFDLFGDMELGTLGHDCWTAKFDHIYPIELPTFDIEPGLDVLLLDMPARSLAQLPIGFAYIYRAVKATGLKMQAIDVDIIAYHRYHMRRCINQWSSVVQEGGPVHPTDPWQAADYLCWTDPKFIDYFSDIINEVVEKIIKAKPKVVGFSLHQTSHASIQRVVDRIRPALPDTVIIVGGMSCYQSIVARHVFPAADYVVVGEGDTSVGPLVLALARGERPKNLPGVVSRFDSEDVKFVGAPLPHNLDFLGGPDYGFTSLDYYRNWNNYRLMPVVGSRGCGWSRCTFCAERFNWRARTPEKVAEEIEYYTTRGFMDFVFNESDFNSNPEFVVRLCNDIVRRGLNIRLTAQLRISKNSDFEYFQTMRRAGFTCLRFGVDGLSTNTLKLQKKGYTKEDVINNLRDCAKLGIYTEINVVIGVPGETDEDVEETAQFIIEMKPYIGRVAFINPLMMFVGSVYYNEPERHDIKFRQDKAELYRKYVVSLPDDSWYSVEPYIDHTVRRERFLRIVDHLHKHNVPMGDFAAFTARHRARHKQDSHTIASLRVRGRSEEADAGQDDLAQVASPTSERRPADIPTADPAATFYGAWSAYVQEQQQGAPAAENAAIVSGDHVVIRRGGKVLRFKSYLGRAARFEPYHPNPTLLEAYRGYNIVGYRETFFGAPQSAGPIDLSSERGQAHPLVVRGYSIEAVKDIIDRIQATLSARPDIVPPSLAVRAETKAAAIGRQITSLFR
jgi:radical SAM superfamily enzyme YgiQ (UPF0313 family)